MIVKHMFGIENVYMNYALLQNYNRFGVISMKYFEIIMNIFTVHVVKIM